jgi:protease IV
MRKHPVILGLLLLLLVGVIFFLAVYFLGSLTGKRSLSLGDHVGVVTVEGVLRDSQDIVRQVEEFSRDEGIKAVVVRIDSPGGGVTPSQEIYESLVELKTKKRIVVSMGSVAASGGYLIACAADKIVANPGTITGSISAIMHFANAEELLKKIGLKSSTVKSGKFKDIGSPTRPMTPEEKALIQALVDDTYDQLLDVIARDRKIPKEALRKIADGRIFTGRQARKLGLVDDLGGMDYAVRLAGKISGIKGKPEVAYPTKKKSTLWELILQQTISTLVGELRKEETRFHQGFYYLYEPSS